MVITAGERRVQQSRGRALLLIAAVELLAMSLWFGVSASAPDIAREWSLSASETSWLTLAVQLGFVAGTLMSALLNLADVVPIRRLIALAALGGGVTNALFALSSDGLSSAIVYRFLTGCFLAGVYPPGMKLVASWYQSSRGFALGVLVGALTLGKATPYLVNAIALPGWRWNVALFSCAAAASAVLIAFAVADGPYALAPSRFDRTRILEVFRNRGVRYASLGYFGHMWELYAMWTWIPVMLRSSFELTGNSHNAAEVASFLVIASGAVGCVVAGLFADRSGRTIITSVAMTISGACCVVIGLFYGAAPTLLLIVALIWGASVVADSAQFSACVTELSDPRSVGTALTLQTSIGFLLTIVSIELIPHAVDLVSWKWAFVLLAPGPILGTLAMLRLRSFPEASRIAQGRR